MRTSVLGPQGSLPSPGTMRKRSDRRSSAELAPRLFEICIAERRCLVSLDLDFADVLRFPPHNTPGIAVLRLPRVTSLSLLTGLVQSLLAALQTASIAGHLWVVEASRIRVYEEARPLEEEQ